MTTAAMFLISTIASIFIAMCTAHLLSKSRLKITNPDGSRFGTIDGLRGFLSLLVVVHHYYIFYFWYTTDIWEKPAIDFIYKFGKMSVCVFFMITGFLFIGKILVAQSVNWFELYRSRFYRIVPLYLLVVFFTILYSFLHTELNVNVPYSYLFKELVAWFVFIGNTVNGYSDSIKITAGVTWTLKYEWFFYISLPVVCFFIKNRLSVLLVFLILVIAILNVTIPFGMEMIYLLYFLFGGVINYLHMKYNDCYKLINVMKSRKASFLSIACIVYLLFSGSKSTSFDMSVCIFLFFTLVVFGNDIFGVLSMKSSKLLGEVSYSIYLTHGIIIYTIGHLVFNEGNFPTFDVYVICMPLAIIFIVFLSTITFKYIEKTSIEYGKRRKNKLNKL
ncbi:acyltransferase family protein [Pectobacterium brasiliense]|uniref:acyltransferase family protein n=1 Tax=Pectobacterium brasiliense TaxID=180957 RepID=UPI0020BEF560|nr:acyltransferase [Pectobacterium brasiliense]